MDNVQKPKGFWQQHEGTLKEIIVSKKIWGDNKKKDYLNLANIMRETHKIEDCDAERIRGKFNGKTFQKWLQTQKRNHESVTGQASAGPDSTICPPLKKRKLEEDEVNNNNNSDDDDGSEYQGEDECDDEEEEEEEEEDEEEEERPRNVSVDNNFKNTEVPSEPFGSKAIVSVNSAAKMHKLDDAPKNLVELLIYLAKDIKQVDGNVLKSSVWMKIFSLIPRSYFQQAPTILSSPNAYYIQYRTDLATMVRPYFDVSSKFLILETTSDPFYSAELGPTKAWKDEKISMPRISAAKGIIPVCLPDDSLLSEEHCERKDYDTEFGRLFELIIPRRKQRFSFDPPPNQIKQQDKAATTIPLHHTKSKNKK